MKDVNIDLELNIKKTGEKIIVPTKSKFKMITGRDVAFFSGIALACGAVISDIVKKINTKKKNPTNKESG